jgi:two-component system response regulator HydG
MFSDALRRAEGNFAGNPTHATLAEALEEQLSVKGHFAELIGQSSQMRAVFKLVEMVSSSNAPVLIEGESGTGKELVARAIHDRSPRKDKPFMAVNCSALTETLLESELFGYVVGSYTGVTANKRGLFEAADGGTLFLDEIGELPPELQPKLLRVLEAREIRRLGSNSYTPVDVRIITATHHDLRAEVNAGRFRADLYFRLAVLPVHLPPLRERPSDIPLIAAAKARETDEVEQDARAAAEALAQALEGLDETEPPDKSFLASIARKRRRS